MKPSELWVLSVRTTTEGEDAVSQFLGSTFGQSPTSYTDWGTDQTTVAVYFKEKPHWNLAKRAELTAGLRQIKTHGLRVAPARFSLRKLGPQDWAESWKRHFKPIEIGSCLLLRPSWSRGHARMGQATVVLDPGLSFGTGQHPTTAFCLEQLVAQRRPAELQSVLDIGAGSGILAIAAAKLGYAPVHAFDSDLQAVRIANSNARRNRLRAKLSFFQRDLTKLSLRPARKYSLICANLISTLLLSEQERILARLQPDGVLLLAGILKVEFKGVQRAYEAAGLRLVASGIGNEWRSAAFAWKKR